MSACVRLFILAVVVVFFITLAGIGILFSNFNPSGYRERLEAAVSGVLGRECRIQGEIETAFFPSFTLRAQDILVQDVEPFQDSPFCTIQEIGFAIPLGALFGQEVVIEELWLDRATVNLKQTPEGRGNWEYGLGGKREEEASPDRGAGEAVRMQPARVQCADVRVVYRDSLNGDAYTAVFKRLELQGAGENKEIPFELAGELQDHGSPRRLQVALAGFSRFSWTEGVSLLLSSMRLTAHGFSDEDKTIQAAGQVSWSFPKKRIQFEDFSGRFGESSFKGNASFTSASAGARASLTGYLHLETLDLDALSGSIHTSVPTRDAGIVRGAPNLVRPTVHGGSQGRPPALSIPGMSASGTGPSPQDLSAKETARGVECLPDPAALHFELTLSADTLLARGLPFKKARISVQSPEEKLLLQYNADLYGGAVAGTAEIDVLCKDIALRASASISNGTVEALTADMEGDWSATGTFNATMEVGGSGSTVSSLLNSMGGKASVHVQNGVIHQFALIPAELPGIIPPPSMLPYERISATAKITDGVATTKDIMFTAPALTGRGGGSLRLVQGQIDAAIDFFPGGKKPSVPVYIRGPYSALSSGVEMRLFRRNVRETSYSPPEDQGEALVRQF